MHPRNGIELLLIALLLCSLGTAASAAARVGIQGGVNQAGLTYRPDIEILDHDLKFRPAWSAGIQWVMPVAALELETGARYVEYGDRYDFEFEITGGTARFSFHPVWRYVAVPALVRFRPAPARGLFVSVGPEVGYLLAVWLDEDLRLQATTPSPVRGGGRSSLRASPGGPAQPMARIFEEVGTFDGLTRYHRRWNLSACASIGFEFPLGRRLGEAQFRYTHGVVDIAKSSQLTRETRGLEMLAGLRW